MPVPCAVSMFGHANGCVGLELFEYENSSDVSHEMGKSPMHDGSGESDGRKPASRAVTSKSRGKHVHDSRHNNNIVIIPSQGLSGILGKKDILHRKDYSFVRLLAYQPVIKFVVDDSSDGDMLPCLRESNGPQTFRDSNATPVMSPQTADIVMTIVCTVSAMKVVVLWKQVVLILL